MSGSLTDLRKEHGQLYLIRIDNVLDIGSVSFIFRLLTLSEYRSYKRIFTTRPHTLSSIEEEIFERCVLKSFVPEELPQDWIDAITEGIVGIEDNLSLPFTDFLPAGIVYSVANAILYLSYPKTVEQFNRALDIERYRQLQDVEMKTKSFLCAVLGYKPSEIDRMTFKELTESIVLAESIVLFRPEVPLVFTTQEEQAVSKKRDGKVNLEELEQDAIATRRAIGGSSNEEELRIEEKYFTRGHSNSDTPKIDPKKAFEELQAKPKKRRVGKG